MPRRQRQVDELLELCRRGEVSRAVDLAFEHFAVFGRDDHVVGFLEAAIGQRAPDDVRRRFSELESTSVTPDRQPVTGGDPQYR